MTETVIEAIAIGASAGTVQALSCILPPLPPGFPLPILIVVHVPADRSNSLIALFQSKCRLPVREAEDKEVIEAGVIYFAPANYHLLVEADRTLALSSDAPVLYSRPSIDVLFESAADAYGAALAAVILTGANEDGAAGLKAVAEAGGIALVEDPSEAFSPEMPSAALNACPDAKSASLVAIASYLVGLGKHVVP
jgi:two-component system, chemotaxis family, protein-glutamate methylesterase/glutaminase